MTIRINNGIHGIIKKYRRVFNLLATCDGVIGMSGVPFLTAFIKDFPLIMVIGFSVFLVTTVGNIVKVFIRYAKKSDFDKIFDTKDQKSWESGFKQLIFALFLILSAHLIGGILAFSINTSNAQSVLLSFLGGLIILTLLLSFILILVHWCLRQFVLPFYSTIVRRNYEPDYEKHKRYFKYLLLTNFISAYLAIYFVAMLSMNQLIAGKPDWLSLLVSILASTLIVLFYFHFSVHLYRDVFKIESPSGKFSYKMIIPHIETVQNHPLFVLYSLDSNRIVLGNHPNEDKCNHLYVYDRDKHRYLLFMKSEINEH
ncbi:hypothetical protein P9302_09175 [Brevibacillus agri]|uniref:hypothetical protein n=1 Tax=Brevibacillus agri TaxID=51101 RepID=UPI002E1AEF39|nr:hypothetical protein [Brevibacillus agri]